MYTYYSYENEKYHSQNQEHIIFESYFKDKITILRLAINILNILQLCLPDEGTLLHRASSTCCPRSRPKEIKLTPLHRQLSYEPYDVMDIK